MKVFNKRRESEREGESVCACVLEREKERECVRVCLRERQRERETTIESLIAIDIGRQVFYFQPGKKSN